MDGVTFVEAMLAEAKRRGILTGHSNIRCPNGKSISRSKLIAIYQRYGHNCPRASTVDLKACGFQSCSFRTFRELAGKLLPPT